MLMEPMDPPQCVLGPQVVETPSLTAVLGAQSGGSQAISLNGIVLTKIAVVKQSHIRSVLNDLNPPVGRALVATG